MSAHSGRLCSPSCYRFKSTARARTANTPSSNKVLWEVVGSSRSRHLKPLGRFCVLRYKGAHGGRGSVSRTSFANLVVANAVRWRGDTGEGYRFACIREVQKSLKAKRQAADRGQAEDPRTWRGARVQGLQRSDRNARGRHHHLSTGCRITLRIASSPRKAFTAHGLRKRIRCRTVADNPSPDNRWENRTLGITSEMWFSWNPQRPDDPIERVLRSHAAPTGAIVVKANWRDNPWFPAVLEQERRDDLANRPNAMGIFGKASMRPFSTGLTTRSI